MFISTAIIHYRQEPLLIWLALAMDATACLAAADMLARPLHPGETGKLARAGRAWTPSAAIVFGCGMWSALMLVVLAWLGAAAPYYDPVAIAVAILVAVGGSLVAFSLARPRDDAASRKDILLAGTALGVTIYATLFVSLAAVRLPGLLSVDPGPRILALAVAIACGIAAMLGAVASRRPLPSPAQRRWRQRATAGLLAMLVAGPPVIGLAGISVTPHDRPPPAAVLSSAVTTALFAVALATVCACVLALAAAVTVLDRRRAIRRQETSRLRQFADGTFEGILIHRDGVVLDVNQALCALLGRGAHHLIGHPVTDAVAPHHVAHAQQRIRSGSCDPAEFEIVTADGPRMVEVLSRSINYEGRDARMVAVRDLTERRAAEDRLRYLAQHDGLTGLANRALLHERLTQALALAERQGQSVAVLGLDLDRFKLVNDLMGHLAGDIVLAEVASRLRDCVRGIDTVARVGGDEFVIVQPGVTDPHATQALALRLIEAISCPYLVDGQQVVLGTSVGLALFPLDGQTAEELLQHADIALYRSKSGGRGTFRFFEPAMNARLIERRQLEHDLRQAMPNGDLALHYEPQFDLMTGAISGCEAVLRWQHPSRGRLLAGSFMHIAEESGLIGQIGPWMLETACRDALRWPARLRVAVNLAPRLVHSAELVEHVGGLLRRIGLPPARLEIEITEGLLTDEPEQVQQNLRGLKDLGLHLALDDFGTGPASLNYLRRYPFDRIKIDGSLVAGIGSDRNATEIVRAILALAHTLRLEVSAEGVTTSEQLALLRAEGCSEVQGPLLYAPMTADELAVMLDEPALVGAID